MKTYTLAFLMTWAIIVSPVFSQNTTFKPNELKTTIKEVTVFLQGANITRTGKVDIPAGKSILTVKALSPHIDSKSVQIKASGNFTVLSVNHKINYLGLLIRGEKIDSLHREMTRLDHAIAEKSARLEILNEMQSLLNANKTLGGNNSGFSLNELKQAIDFYDRELSAIKVEELKTSTEINDLKEQRTRLTQQVSAVAGQKDKPSGEVEVRIEAEVKTKGEFTITYLVANAGWFPNYDIRVENVEKPIRLKYKADVYQNTGVDWDNVKLRFSNGDPNQSGIAPKLHPWLLNYARYTFYDKQGYALGTRPAFQGKVSGVITDENGLPLPGASITIRGSSTGTAADMNGRYSLVVPQGVNSFVVSYVGYNSQEIPINAAIKNIRLTEDTQELQEVVVRGYSSKKSKLYGSSAPKMEIADMVNTTTIENQTTVEFEIETPYSIKSNGEKLGVELNEYDIETHYEYYAVPKIDKDAFLMARIINWDQYNLLEGEANLYFEDSYVGRTILDAKSLSDTLSISLGRDKNIVIGRKKMEEFSKRRTVGMNKLDTRGFEIMVRNKKSQAITLHLLDQVPVSAISDIAITPLKLSGGKLNEQTGEVTWELKLEGQQQKDLELKYEVKYPRRERVDLE
ncbi:MAG: mucoidy inhibitor MuiA family protein [Cyclobacteriaceae bacterium]|nr:mucoidy inhibitor MuiA family protein [Cyclobacteriaceae bacterium]